MDDTHEPVLIPLPAWATAQQLPERVRQADYDTDCPACLRGRSHTQAEHEMILRHVYAARWPRAKFPGAKGTEPLGGGAR